MLDALDVPDWDFASSASVMYPSLEAAGKIQARNPKRDEKRLLQKLIEGTVRLGDPFGKYAQLNRAKQYLLLAPVISSIDQPRNLHLPNTSACSDPPR